MQRRQGSAVGTDGGGSAPRATLPRPKGPAQRRRVRLLAPPEASLPRHHNCQTAAGAPDMQLQPLSGCSSDAVVWCSEAVQRAPKEE